MKTQLARVGLGLPAALACAFAGPVCAVAQIAQAPLVKNSAGQIVAATPVFPVNSAGEAAAPGSALPVSGVAPVTGTFTATGNGAVFTPAAGRPFNLTVYSTGGTAPGSSLNASVYLARSIDGGTTYLPMTAAGGGIYAFTSLANESLYESQTGVTYRLVCTSYASGTVNFRFAQ